MRFAKAREGEKFVFPEEGGIWKKVGHGAERVFPKIDKGETPDKIEHVDPQLEVYVIFDTKPAGRSSKEKTPTVMEQPMRIVSERGQGVVNKGGMGLVITLDGDDRDATILSFPDATPEQVAAYTSMEWMKLSNKAGEPEVFHVEEFGMDADQGVCVVEVSAVGGD